jgi:hypothetical protein
MNRRKFCLSSLAAAISGTAAVQTAHASPGSPTQAVATLTAAMPGVPVYKFIYDRRFSAGRAFGAAAKRGRSSAATVGIDGDITALWALDLQPRWLAGDGAIAGVTTARTLFCLEQLAHDHRMRVLSRAEQPITDGGEIKHLVSFVIA